MQQQKKKLAKDVIEILERLGADLGASGEPNGKPELEEIVEDLDGEETNANS